MSQSIPSVTIPGNPRALGQNSCPALRDLTSYNMFRGAGFDRGGEVEKIDEILKMPKTKSDKLRQQSRAGQFKALRQ